MRVLRPAGLAACFIRCAVRAPNPSYCGAYSPPPGPLVAPVSVASWRCPRPVARASESGTASTHCGVGAPGRPIRLNTTSYLRPLADLICARGRAGARVCIRACLRLCASAWVRAHPRARPSARVRACVRACVRAWSVPACAGGTCRRYRLHPSRRIRTAKSTSLGNADHLRRTPSPPPRGHSRAGAGGRAPDRASRPGCTGRRCALHSEAVLVRMGRPAGAAEASDVDCARVRDGVHTDARRRS